MAVFRIYTVDNGKESPHGGDEYILTFPEKDVAITRAQSLIGVHDSLRVKNEDTGEVVWELADARSAPKSEGKF